jgi:hypothetical protein
VGEAHRIFCGCKHLVDFIRPKKPPAGIGSQWRTLPGSIPASPLIVFGNHSTGAPPQSPRVTYAVVRIRSGADAPVPSGVSEKRPACAIPGRSRLVGPGSGAARRPGRLVGTGSPPEIRSEGTIRTGFRLASQITPWLPARHSRHSSRPDHRKSITASSAAMPSKLIGRRRAVPRTRPAAVEGAEGRRRRPDGHRRRAQGGAVHVVADHLANASGLRGR